ncbi:hypothetical protein LWF15_00870 [Kineosporia rhizophila]|uniref:hypothetical protein n=1 Tax=Kineosporia TaxID=49184 RepID=UPI000AD1DB99|nr:MULTISPECIES: hypothetical protein [Kineosporia]MCE0534058.1 hypothetical protein [Kineosporia rhizophila]GLY13600.1 hypothetical protein Kisp01_06160 [Kineosporia sp. NBRC 101677]
MRPRPLILALGAASALTISLLAPAGAASAAGESTPKPLEKIVKSANRAATAGDDCSITDYGPQKITLGLVAKTVQFAVSTTCDDADHDMKWAVTGDLFPGSAHATWFGACTYTYTGPATLNCPKGQDELDVIGTGTFKGNQMAGTKKAYIYAFDDANGNGRDDDTKIECDDDGNCTKTSSGRDDITGTVQLLRRTSWGKNTDKVSKEKVKAGEQITLTSQLTRANWDTAKNEKFSPTVKLQFKPNTQSTFKTVRTVPSTGTGTSVTVTAKRSGVFRFAFRGDEQSNSSISWGVAVTVTK